ncbi:hypothetical protein QE152_g13333 [Popillia japonica]|uniref:Uncharacterized protein n=1 Tax=Popillia japonica TaxID=7064 RepID=A0AAW1LEG9_POPJA
MKYSRKLKLWILSAEITDEDSGNEDRVSVHNQSSSHLKAQAETVKGNADGFDFDDEDNIALSFLAEPSTQAVYQLSKRKKIYDGKERDINCESFSNSEKPNGSKNNVTS